MYISLSELIHVLKAVTIATSEHLNLLTIFVVIAGTAEGEGLVGPRPHHFFAPPPPLLENQIL